MKFTIIGALLVLVASDLAHAAPAPTSILWQEGQNRILSVSCADDGDRDEYCRAIQVSPGPGTVGDGYVRVKVLWSKRPGGPDALLLGEYGGSGGLADLIAVSFSPRVAVWKMDMEHGEEVTLDQGGGVLCLQLPFGIGGFNGAPDAGATEVPLPVCWSSGKFVLNRKSLLSRSFPEEDLRFREVAVRNELQRWASDSYPATNFYPIKTTGGTPVTARALFDLMIAGHADVARAILHRSWPKTYKNYAVPMGGEQQFWNSLCRLIVRNDDWTRFQLGQLPHADLMEESAKSGEESSGGPRSNGKNSASKP